METGSWGWMRRPQRLTWERWVLEGPRKARGPRSRNERTKQRQRQREERSHWEREKPRERGSRQRLSLAWETADIFYFQKQFFIHFVKLKSRF